MKQNNRFKKFIIKLFRIKPETVTKEVIKEIVIYQPISNEIKDTVYIEGDLLVSGKLVVTGEVIAYNEL